LFVQIGNLAKKALQMLIEMNTECSRGAEEKISSPSQSKDSLTATHVMSENQQKLLQSVAKVGQLTREKMYFVKWLSYNWNNYK